jgi:ketosteroid isomerase-like protein
MRKPFLFCAILLAWVQLLSRASEPETTVGDAEQLQKRGSVWSEAFAKHDVRALAELLAPDVQMSSADGQWNGKSACVALFQSLFATRPDISFVLKPSESRQYLHWNSAFMTGDWSEAWTEKDGPVEIVGRYFILWQRDSGIWHVRNAVFAPLECRGKSKFCQ